MRKTIIALAVLLTTAIAQADKIDDVMLDVVNLLNEHTPQRLDSITEISHFSYFNRKMSVNHSITPTEEMPKEFWTNPGVKEAVEKEIHRDLVNSVCSNPKLLPALEVGISVERSYSLDDGTYLFDTETDISECPAKPQSVKYDYNNA